jgi:hypothetical protein
MPVELVLFLNKFDSVVHLFLVVFGLVKFENVNFTVYAPTCNQTALSWLDCTGCKQTIAESRFFSNYVLFETVPKFQARSIIDSYKLRLSLFRLEKCNTINTNSLDTAFVFLTFVFLAFLLFSLLLVAFENQRSLAT